MIDSEMVITLDNDDDSFNGKETDSSASSNSSKTKRTRLTFPFGACRVCADSATGIHYGIATCEGCKGFFKRSILRKEKYRCYFDNTCLINVTNRNRCKACRFRRCLDEGMSVDGVKMGRIPKLVKERALKELKEQQMKEEAALAEFNEAHSRTGSCSSSSDRSIENYDPNGMDTDFVESEDSLIPQMNKKKPLVSPSPDNEKATSPILHRTKYPTFLPVDFTVDELEGVSEQPNDLLTDDFLKPIKTIAKKLAANPSLTIPIALNDDEVKLIRYLRWSSHNTFIRRSKRAKQLVSRMNQMIENNIHEYPGDNATLAEFFNSIRLACEIYIPGSVVYVQELSGMKNISLQSLQKMITHRTFDWHLLKYHELYHHGECYFLAPNGFQFTRHWMNELHGSELANGMFQFCQCLRELHLSETEFALVLAFHMCYDDSTMEDQEFIQMLRSCYFYALYTELNRNRGENEAKTMCNRILQTLELLIPLNKLFQDKSASRTLDVEM